LADSAIANLKISVILRGNSPGGARVARRISGGNPAHLDTAAGFPNFNPFRRASTMGDVIDLDEKEFEKNQQAFSDVLAKYYGDPDFRAKLEADPTAVLKAEGVDIPPNTTVELLFNTDKLVHIVLPYIEGEDA